MERNLGSLVDEAARAAPYEFFKRIRTEKPVYRLPGSDVYLITTHELIKTVVRDIKTFSNELPQGQTAHHNSSSAADRVLQEKGFGRRIKTIANHDPPGHYAFRRLMSGILSPTIIQGMEARVREDAQRLLDAIDTSQPCDVVEAVTLPLPLLVISDLLGVERSDFQTFKIWAAASLYQNKPPQTEEALVRDAELIAEMQHYLVGVMNDRRKNPRDDTVTRLVNAKLNDERLLTEKEILSILELFILAGAETTTNAMGNSLIYFIDNPSAEQAVREASGRMADVVEELLRLESSVTGIWRSVTCDTVLDGVPITAGSKLILAYGPSNWDEAIFDEPRQFVLDRPNIKDHFAFGSGIHVCLGNSLARLELKVMLEQWFTTFSKFKLAIDRSQIAYQPFMTLRGPTSLPLSLERH